MRALLTFLAAAAVAGPALAGVPVVLKADPANVSGIVTLGDLFDGAGAAGRVAIAQRTAASVVLDAGVVQAAARRAGLDWDNAQGLHRIIVRAGEAALSAQGAAQTASVSVNPSAGAPAAASRGNVEVLTYTRSLNTGDVVQPTDLAWIKAVAAPAGAPNDADSIIGQAAKRPVKAGAVVLVHDVGVAQVIKRGDIVIVTYEAEGITLALEGTATASAGVGEVLAVENTTSKKIIQSVVTGPGQAVAGPAAVEMRNTHQVRYAAR
ncbi:flagellar basal body P-ring formation chaperone FlgA [Phenylobacterium sp.]|uniref:flagellar basal body P-ring formation chaperone FlgA n=1 Tax=Phenylobacterium sp. TaxID=1871053 RepID=UPI0012247FCD|nr:flagellar basal body P-ring formation chaperone FlgA [Phenylobacterium sp.]THD62245.1 MAG: flagellar basal body P-ring formation protein FlgA [Phenylobacterium sp.]